MNHGDCVRHPADAAVAQSVERHIGNVEVTGSIPVSSSFERQNPAKAGFCFAIQKYEDFYPEMFDGIREDSRWTDSRKTENCKS